MDVTTRCPACESEGHHAAFGVVAPWIDELFGSAGSTETQLLDCATCGLSFFARRYTEHEMGLLYGGYRGPDYLAIRQKWEPWYRRNVNDAYEPASTPTTQRVAYLEESLRIACPGRHWSVILDIGGDEGQFFPHDPKSRKFLVDPSEKALQPGVVRIPKLSELQEKADLVILAHVLEHLPDPLSQLVPVRDSMAADGILYVEVPWDRPSTKKPHATGSFARHLGRISRRRAAFVASDFLSGIMRQTGLRALPLPVIKQSEHINYFSPASLTYLLNAAGFEVVSLRSDRAAKPAGMRLGLISAVAQMALPPRRRDGADDNRSDARD